VLPPEVAGVFMSTTPRILSRRRVLIVDDHPFVREGLKQVIEQQPDFIVCADVSSIAEALRAIKKLRPDLALVDLSLDESSGLDLIKQIRDEERQMPILVLSMHEESLHTERVLRAGAQGYIMKREAPEQVLKAMRQVMKGRCYLSDQMTGRLVRRYISRRNQPEAEHSLVGQLSDREAQVLQLIGQGHRRGRIADLLHVSVKTVETHCQRIKEKLGLHSADELRQHAFLWAQQTAPSGPAAKKHR